MYDTGNELLRVVTFGDITRLGNNPLLRLHSSCLASEVFEAQDCDCADQLRETMKVMAHEGSGIIFHLHQEGRGQGLSKKIQAVYKMQTEALDTAEAFQVMGLEQDIRDYESAIELLKKMLIGQVRLVSNNPRKQYALEQAGIKVELVNTHPQVRPENADYLKSKNDKLGHCIQLGGGDDDFSPIHFYHSDQTWGEFSNFSQHAVYLKGKIWSTTEHFYQAQKFNDPVQQELVRSSKGPMLAKVMAKKLEEKNLQSNWHFIKEEVMCQALNAKFTQHPELKELLLSTQQRHITERARNDSYWGDGEDGKGLNRLGELLMRLRLQLHINKELELCAE
jgi:GTP cyclohydrolase II